MINKNDNNYKEIEQMCAYIASQRVNIGDLEKLADLLNFFIINYYFGTEDD